MKKRIFTALPVLLLCGCQLPLQPRINAPKPVQTVASPSKPALQLTQLWMEGDLHDGTPLPIAVIRADSDRVTVSWSGDAVELLNQLARARGQRFSYVGVRLPLPVDINVQGVTYTNLLRIIKMQTAWRSTLINYPGQMTLQFMTTVATETQKPLKGGRR